MNWNPITVNNLPKNINPKYVQYVRLNVMQSVSVSHGVCIISVTQSWAHSNVIMLKSYVSQNILQPAIIFHFSVLSLQLFILLWYRVRLSWFLSANIVVVTTSLVFTVVLNYATWRQRHNTLNLPKVVMQQRLDWDSNWWSHSHVRYLVPPHHPIICIWLKKLLKV